MPQSTVPQKDDTPSGSTYRGLSVPSQAEVAFGKLVTGQGGRMENDEGGMLGGTEDNWDFRQVNSCKPVIKPKIME